MDSINAVGMPQAIGWVVGSKRFQPARLPTPQAYYCRGSSPVVPPSLQAADEGSSPGVRASKASSSAAGSSGDTSYASWQVHYEVRAVGAV